MGLQHETSAGHPPVAEDEDPVPCPQALALLEQLLLDAVEGLLLEGDGQEEE